MSVWREINELICSFNDHFHRAFMRLQDPYVHNDVVAFPIYYAALDNLTSALVKRMLLPLTTLVSAYAEAIIASAYLGHNISGPLPSLGLVAHPMQVQGLNQAFAHQTPLMNHVPKLPITPHLGQSMNHAPPMPSYLQPQQQQTYLQAPQ